VCRSVKLSTGGFIMSTNTVERSVEACALDAATLCEAFQISAATHPERVAVRTSGDAVVLTWAQYAEQVRRTAARHRRRSRFRSVRELADGGPTRRCVAGLHLGHDRAAQRGPADPRRRDRQRSRAARGDSGLPGRFLGGVLPTAGSHCRAGPGALLRPTARWNAEKLQASVTAAVTVKSGDQLQEAIETGLRLVRAQQAGEQPSAALVAEYARADAVVLSGLRARLGLDRIETAAVGAARVPSEVIEFFWALGVPLCELYGMSEVLISTVNPIDRVKIGTVGVPVTGVEVRVAEDGEVLMRGPSVMLGYLNQPDKTAATIDAHGWLHSGDIGELDGDGYLRITDRKKEMIINIGGHNMSPANIEARLKTSSPLIGQAVCIGDTRPFNVALLVLDPDAARAFAVQHDLDGCSVSALTRQRCVLDEVAAGVARANTQLSLPEQIQRWTLLNSEWLPGGVELTPTMKLQRRPITTKYENEIRALYQ
jgi:acyl-CoA synthetase (AMP-forming)/AMP-acid ligase II